MAALPLAAAGLWAGILAGWGRWQAPAAAAAAILGAGAAALLLGEWVRRRSRALDPLVGERLPLSGRDRILGAAGLLPSPDRRRGPGRVGRGAALLLACVALGAGWAGLRIREPQAGALESRVAAFAGIARSDPRSSSWGWGLEASVSLQGEPGDRRAWIAGRGTPPMLAAGQPLAGRGAVLAVEPQGGFGTYLADRGVEVLVSPSDLEVLGPPPSAALRIANALRRGLRRGAFRALPERPAGLLLGLTIGDVDRMHPETEEDFRATGLGHLVAVSGSNVVMVLAPILALAALLGLRVGGRVAVGIAGVLLFALVTRWEPSVVRASAMAVLGLVGILTGRRRETAVLLAGAVAILLLVDPRLARSLGFRLSVAATVGLVALTPRIAARLWFLPRPLALATAATAGAQAAVTPLLLGAFGVVPTVTLLANILAVPAVAVAFLGGSAAAGVALVAPPLGAAVGRVAAVPLAYLEWVADRTARLPLPSLVGMRWAVAAAGAACVWLMLRRVPRLRRVAVLLVLPLAALGLGVQGRPPDGLEIRFLDVGQGDAAVVRTPEGTTLVVDAGPDPQEVATRLAALGVGRVDLAVASHAHADHVEGFPAIFSRHPVGVLLEPGCPAESPSYRRLLEAARFEDVPIRRPRGGRRFAIGSLSIEVLGPDRCAVDSPNDDSLVLRLAYGAATVLLPGDAEVPSQRDLLGDGDPVTASLLKVPHHGSRTSDPAFLAEVGAALAVVSVGENDFGHPAPATMAALRAAGSRVLRTDRLGEVVIRFGPDGPRVG